MPKFYFNCYYCDRKWEEILYSIPATLKCPDCKDRNIKIKERPEKSNIFGYDEDDNSDIYYITESADWQLI